MNKIQELAYRNVKKYKKHYLFVSVLIFLVSVFFLSCTMIFNNQYEAEKMYKQNKYGTWYYKATLLSMDEKNLIGVEAETLHESYKYSFIYDQGYSDDGYKIGYAEKEMFDFAKIKLIQGELPTKDNEIAISAKMKKEKRLDINDCLELSLDSKTSLYTIIGIVENSQENIFPDIYTNIEYGIQLDVYTNQELDRNFTKYKPYNPNLHAWVKDVYINEYGYIGTPAGANNALNVKEMIVLSEALILTIFILIVLNFTSLKRRNKEFALLRGIGMTSKQLFSMIVYEMSYTLIVSLFIAFLLSFGVSYLGTLICYKLYGYFIYNINIGQLLIYTILLFFSIFVSMLYPIHASCRTALSGSFEGTKFKKIQIRYRQLKYQNKWRLALRDLSVQKNITISLLVIFFVSIILIITNSIDENLILQSSITKSNFESFQYYEVIDDSGESSHYEMYNQFLKENKYTGKIYTRASVYEDIKLNGIETEPNIRLILPNYICLLDDDIIKNSIIDGRLPQNDNEIVVGFGTYLLKCEIIGNDIGYSDDKQLSLGDSFILNDKEYTVVGEMRPNEELYLDSGVLELYYAPYNTIYLLEDTYQQWLSDNQENYCLRVYFNDIEEHNMIKSKLLQLTNGNYEITSPLDTIQDYIEYTPNISLQIDLQLLLIPIIVCLILAYYLNKNYISNNASDIALSKLIGMTNKEIIIKQLCKALFISSIVIGFTIFWIGMINLYYEILFMPILELILCICIVLFSTIIIYCLPLKDILKNNVFDLIKGEE